VTEKRPGRTTGLLRSAATRLSWGVADQGVSSLTNLVVGAVVARALGPVEFGAFSLAWVTYSVALNLSRGLATDPLAVRFSGVAIERWRAATAQATTAAFGLGLVAGLVCVVAGGVMGGPVGGAFMALGLVLPPLLLQDSWRFAFFATGAGHRAFVNDAVWAVLLVPAMYLAASAESVFAYVLAWGVAGALAAVFGYLQTRLRPVRVGAAVAWIRHQSDLGVRYMVENVSAGVAAQLRMYGLGVLAGLADVGAVRGGQLLLGPFLAVMMGLSSVAVPEAARMLLRSARRLAVFCLAFSAVQAVVALVWGAALLTLVPERFGAFLLGDVWPAALALVVPTTLLVVFGCFVDGAKAGLRALGAARRSLRSQLAYAVLYVGFGLVGAVLDGARGSTWGVAIAALVGAAITWSQLRTGLRDYVAARPSEQLAESAPLTDSKGGL